MIPKLLRAIMLITTLFMIYAGFRVHADDVTLDLNAPKVEETKEVPHTGSDVEVQRIHFEESEVPPVLVDEVDGSRCVVRYIPKLICESSKQ